MSGFQFNPVFYKRSSTKSFFIANTRYTQLSYLQRFPQRDFVCKTNSFESERHPSVPSLRLHKQRVHLSNAHPTGGGVENAKPEKKEQKYFQICVTNEGK